MSVVISRSKKHLSLGRLITQASTTLGRLSNARTHIAMALSALANLEGAYEVFKDNGKDIPRKIIASVDEEHEEVIRIAKSLLMIMNVVDANMKKTSANLENFNKELEKAEKRHEMELKKAQKAKKPSKEGVIKAVTAEILASKKDELEKK
jgi:hypothetical protein